MFLLCHKHWRVTVSGVLDKILPRDDLIVTGVSDLKHHFVRSTDCWNGIGFMMLNVAGFLIKGNGYTCFIFALFYQRETTYDFLFTVLYTRTLPKKSHHKKKETCSF